MLLIPAIDLKDGRCVRLRQGRMDEETLFSDDPVAMAGRWVSEGARRLHLVDLNGAFAGQPVNGDVIRAIAEGYPDLPLQVGGGIRDEATIAAYLDAGVSYCIIGTQAVKEPELVTRACQTFPGRVIVGLDARDGRVAIKGWAQLTEHRVEDLAKRFEDAGVSAIVYTDIGRDGMMTGPNLEATRALAEAISIPVIASGGITVLDDVHALCTLSDSGVTAAITGRAIYEGTLDFREGQRVAGGCRSETAGTTYPANEAIVLKEDSDESWLDDIQWDDKGLAPAIAQETGSGKILMMAWMNRESLALTRETGHAVYWSRSRRKLWHKGEESGHQQVVRAIRLDCDADVILLEVEQRGGIACHTGRHNCFFRELRDGKWIEIAPVLKDPAAIYKKS